MNSRCVNRLCREVRILRSHLWINLRKDNSSLQLNLETGLPRLSHLIADILSLIITMKSSLLQQDLGKLRRNCRRSWHGKEAFHSYLHQLNRRNNEARLVNVIKLDRFIIFDENEFSTTTVVTWQILVNAAYVKARCWSIQSRCSFSRFTLITSASHVWFQHIYYAIYKSFTINRQFPEELWVFKVAKKFLCVLHGFLAHKRMILF